MSLLHRDRYGTLWTKHFIILFFMSKFTLPVNNLYRAMLCVSVAFAVVWCPSACLSVTFVYCIQMAGAIVKHLPLSGSHIILVFLMEASIPNSDRNIFSRGAKYTGREGNLQFATEITVYIGNGTRQADGCYGTLIASHM